MKVMKDRKESRATSHYLIDIKERNKITFHIDMKAELKGKTLFFDEFITDDEIDLVFSCVEQFNQGQLKFIKKSRIDWYNVHRRKIR